MGNISVWDVSTIIVMGGLLADQYSSNDGISFWNTAKVTNMAQKLDHALVYQHRWQYCGYERNVMFHR